MTFIKYPKIRRVNDWFLGKTAVGYDDIEGMFNHPGDILIIQEKIDGANFRFMITDDDKVLFGTRKNLITDENDKSMKNFKRGVKYVRKMVEDTIASGKQMARFRRKVYFAEGLWKHSINYDWMSFGQYKDEEGTKNIPIIGYDIWDIDAEAFLPLEIVDTLYHDLGIRTVPLVMKAPVSAFTEPFTDNDVPQSKFYNGSAEGIVIKNYETQHIAKYVPESVKQDQKKNFGSPPKLAEDDTEWLVAKFVTNTRIESSIFKLLDEGEKLGLHLMKYLPKLVLDDIWEEEFKSVYNSGKTYTFDFRMYRKLTQFRCKAVLRNIIENNLLASEPNDKSENTS